MNKIGVSQTCLYNISYHKDTGFLQQPVTTEGIWLYNTNLATVHSRVTVGGCLVKYEYKLVHQLTTTVGRTRCYYSQNRCLITLQTAFKKLFMWPCSNVIQIDKTQVYGILCATTRGHWHSSLYLYSAKQPSTVTQLCTQLYWTIAEYHSDFIAYINYHHVVHFWTSGLASLLIKPNTFLCMCNNHKTM